MQSRSLSYSVRAISAFILIAGNWAWADDARTPTRAGNGRVYAQRQTVIGTNLVRFTAIDAGPAQRKADAEFGMRLLEVVRSSVGDGGAESDQTVIYRQMLSPGHDGRELEEWHMDLLVCIESEMVFLAMANDTDYLLVAFKMDASPLPRDGALVFDRPLPPNASDEQTAVAYEVARRRHRWTPAPLFDPHKVFVRGIRDVRLDLEDKEIVLALRNRDDEKTDAELRLRFSTDPTKKR